MRLDHRLQQELDNFWMQITPHQHLGGGSYEWHVGGWDVLVNINNTSRQYQPNEFREYDGERLCRWKAHEPDAGIYQQGVNSYPIRRAFVRAPCQTLISMGDGIGGAVVTIRISGDIGEKAQSTLRLMSAAPAMASKSALRNISPSHRSRRSVAPLMPRDSSGRALFCDAVKG
jgi:hypothetical protein